MKKNIIYVNVILILFFSAFNIFAKDNAIEFTEILVDQSMETTHKEDDTVKSTKILVNQDTKTDCETDKKVLPKQVKGIHLTTLATDSQFYKTRINDLLDNTELNAVVIDIKETDGNISIKNVLENITYSKTLPDVEQYLKEVKEKGMYAIARIAAFRDNAMPRKRTELAVKNPDGSLWQDKNKITWLNPYKQETINYILDLAEKTADVGFDEIQFDYIRFPSDGKVGNCRYGVKHSSATASETIVNFLKQARQRLSSKGIKISIDVFGLTTTEKSDMGIGQKIVEMTEQVDYVCPMIYPSHYGNGDYGIANPNKEPYRTVYIALQGAKKRLPVKKLRPWLQDFSLRGVKYGPAEIQAQIQACYDCGVETWLLWNAACKYTKTGLKTKEKQYSYVKTPDEKIKKLLKYKDVDYSMQQRAAKKVNSVKKSTFTGTKKY